jgi:hypothetical protein
VILTPQDTSRPVPEGANRILGGGWIVPADRHEGAVETDLLQGGRFFQQPIDLAPA